MGDYFIFNGTKSTDKGIVLKEYRPIFLANNRINYKEIPGRDGSLEGPNAGKQDVIIRCTVAIIGDNIIQAAEAANDWLDQKGELKFYDMEDKYYIGRVTGEVVMKNQEAWGDFELNFRCSPYKISTTEKTVNLGDQGYNEGTYNTPGLITVNLSEAATSLEVKLQETGEKVRIEDSLKNADIIEIDLEAETVKKNGQLIQEKVTLESDFFKIPAGPFKITTTEGTGTVKFRERWK